MKNKWSKSRLLLHFFKYSNRVTHSIRQIMARFLSLLKVPGPKYGGGNSLVIRFLRTYVPRSSEDEEEEDSFLMNVYGDSLAPQDLFVSLITLLSRTKEDYPGYIKFDGQSRMETLVNVKDTNKTIDHYLDGGKMFDIVSDPYSVMNEFFFDFTTDISDRLYASEVPWIRQISRKKQDGDKDVVEDLHNETSFVEGMVRFPVEPLSKNRTVSDFVYIHVDEEGTVHCKMTGSIRPKDSWVFIILEVLFGGDRSSRVTWGKSVLMFTMKMTSKKYTNALIYQQIIGLYAAFDGQDTFLEDTIEDRKGYVYSYSYRGELGQFVLPLNKLVKSMNDLAPNVNVRT